MSKIKWRSELIVVKKAPDELWIAEKFQSNSEIAGSPRNSFRTSLDFKIRGGRALKELGAQLGYRTLSNYEYHIGISGVRLRELSSVVKRERAQIVN